MTEMLTGTTMPRLTEALRKAADDAFAEHPQYAGHHDDWVPMRVRRRIVTKGGLKATAGEIVLADRGDYAFSTQPSRCFVSRDYGYGWTHVVVPASHLEPLP